MGFLEKLFGGNRNRAWAQRIVDRLTLKPIKVEINPDESVNAYAIIGEDGNEYVIVTEGTFRRLSEDELYFVLAHEVAHHIKNHLYVRRLTYGLVDSFLNAIRPKPSWFERIFKGKTDSPWWVELLALISTVLLNKTVFLNEEKEADLTAVELLKAAQLPTAGAIKFLKRLQMDSTIFDMVMGLIDEHPSPEARMENLLQHYPELAKR